MGSGSRSLQGKCWFLSTLGILCFFTPAHLPCSSLLQGAILLLQNIPSGLEMELSWSCGCFKCSNVLDLIPSTTQTGQGGTLQNSGSGDRGIRSSSHPWLQSEFKTSLGYIRSCCLFFFFFFVIFSFDSVFGLVIKPSGYHPSLSARIKLSRCSLLWQEGLEGENT